MALVLMTVAVGFIVFLAIAMLGGIGLVTGIFGGISSIPMFAWIIMGVVIILTFLKK